MSDSEITTDNIRRGMVERINGNPKDRQALEKEYGRVWDTVELMQEFDVLAFAAPFVNVVRVKDGVRGALTFQHEPRFYFNWKAR